MTQFVNINKCFSFHVLGKSTQYVQLSSFTASEVLIINDSGGPLYIYDGPWGEGSTLPYDAPAGDILARSIKVADTQSIVIRGITNTNTLSVKTTTSEGDVWCRSAYYSNLNQK